MFGCVIFRGLCYVVSVEEHVFFLSSHVAGSIEQYFEVLFMNVNQVHLAGRSEVVP